MIEEELNENLSPCIGVCQYNDEDLCSGCFRTSKEISEWSEMTIKDKKKIMNLLPSRIEDLF